MSFLIFGFIANFVITLSDLPMKTHRLARVAEVVREVAAETILFELQDPRVKGVTVTRAEVAAWAVRQDLLSRAADGPQPDRQTLRAAL